MPPRSPLPFSTLYPVDAQIAVVTGGCGALGSAIAEAFTATGYEVLAPGRDELDVAAAASVEAFFSRLGSIAVLVNNAGLAGDSLVARLGSGLWDKVVDANLKGAFLCSRAAAARMEPGAGIVQIGSYAAEHPSVGQAAYAASKAGLVGLTKSLARELGPAGIRVNCVLPGFLETPMTASLPDPAREAALARHVLGRFNTPAEAARAVQWIATMPHVSGQVFQLDSRP